MEDVHVGDMVDVIKKAGGEILENVDLFDIYQGEQVDSGCKSVAVKLMFRHHNRTLTQEEINEGFNKILSRLETTFNAKLRA